MEFLFVLPSQCAECEPFSGEVTPIRYVIHLNKHYFKRSEFTIGLRLETLKIQKIRSTSQCAVKDLLRSSKVSRVLVADNDEGSLAELKNNLKREGTNEKVEFSKTDVRNAAETSSKLRGFDVVINAVQYYHNLEVMEAALRAEVNYLDFGGLYYKTLEQIQRF